MKKILLFILAVIIIFFSYSEYKEYQRFHPKNANIEASNTIDVNYHNQETVLNYYNAIEAANIYMQMQWSANEIDVRSPESNAEETIFAITEYGKKVGTVNYYKVLLEQSLELKSKGFTNEDVKFFETKGVTLKEYTTAKTEEEHQQLILDMMPKKALFSGEKSAFVYEMQKLLEKKGYDIPMDGVYKNITSDALKSFEEKNNLFSDGKIDLLTLKKLLD